MSNFETNKQALLGDYDLLVGSFLNCKDIYKRIKQIEENKSESPEEIESRKKDLLSNLGKVGEKIFKYLVGVDFILVNPNENPSSFEVFFRRTGEGMVKQYANLNNVDPNSTEVHDALNLVDENGQKTHNFEYWMLLLKAYRKDIYVKMNQLYCYRKLTDLIYSIYTDINEHDLNTDDEYLIYALFPGAYGPVFYNYIIDFVKNETDKKLKDFDNYTPDVITRKLMDVCYQFEDYKEVYNDPVVGQSISEHILLVNYFRALNMDDKKQFKAEKQRLDNLLSQTYYMMNDNTHTNDYKPFMDNYLEICTRMVDDLCSSSYDVELSNNEEIMEKIHSFKDDIVDKGDLFTRYRYYNNNKTNKMHDIDDIFYMISTFMSFAEYVHKNNDSFDFSVDKEYFYETIEGKKKIFGFNVDDIINDIAFRIEAAMTSTLGKQDSIEEDKTGDYDYLDFPLDEEDYDEYDKYNKEYPVYDSFKDSPYDYRRKN